MYIPSVKFFEYFKNTAGAMSCAEAMFMYNACLQIPDEGVLLEMGTHKCKSALVLLLSMAGSGDDRDFYLLEPEFSNPVFLLEAVSNVKKFSEYYQRDNECIYMATYSTDFLPLFDNYAYIMWDSGSHGEELVQPEKKLLQDRMVKGGIIVMHDINSQFIACTEAYNELIASGNYEAIEFDWNEIFDYVKQNNLEEGNNSWHQYPELNHPPNFIGALRRK